MLPLRSDSPSTASLYASLFVSIGSLLLLFALLFRDILPLASRLHGCCFNEDDAINVHVGELLADGGAATCTAGSVRPGKTNPDTARDATNKRATAANSGKEEPIVFGSTVQHGYRPAMRYVCYATT